MKAPAAVVGFQMTHTAFQGFFQNITYGCNGDKKCTKHCGDDDVDCYLIDNHGYIVAAKEATKAGRFLGDVNGLVMNSLVEREIFDRVVVFDYQAVCFRYTFGESNEGSVLLSV